MAARLDAAEAERYRAIERIDAGKLTSRIAVHAVASECPECGWELPLPDAERIHFCEHCRSAVEVGDKGLELRRYQCERAADAGGAERLLWLPFWVVGFRAPAEGPAPGRLFVPARSVYGTPEADAALAELTAHTSRRAPQLSRDRPLPHDREELLGADLEPAQAAELARYALVTLPDMRSTLRMNGRSFRRRIAECEIDPAEPELALIPLPLTGGHWRPAGGVAVAAELLRRAPGLARITKSYPLRARPPRSSC